MDFPLSLTSLISSIFILSTITLITLSVYRLLLHPLASFPGPKLAALTYAYETYFDVFVSPGGQFTYQLDRLHDIYGPVVRCSPDEIHVRESAFYDKLYAGAGHVRDKWERANRANGSPGSVASTVNSNVHRARRAAMNPFFSKRAIAQLESGVRKRVEKLVAHLRDDHASEQNRVFDIGAGFTAVTLDVISEYCYDDCYNLLEEPEAGLKYKRLMVGIFQAAPVMKHFPLVAKMMQSLPAWAMEKINPDFDIFVKVKTQIDRKSEEVYNESHGSIMEGTDPDARPKTVFHGIMQSALPSSDKTAERLSDESFVLLMAGSETTARVMTVTLVQLLQNPALLARLRRELDPVVSNGLPTAQTLEGILLLRAVIQEGCRMATPVSNRQPLIAPDEDLQTGDGWVIPRGTPISMTHRNVSLDPSIFQSPHTFDPDRWLLPSSPTDSSPLSRYLVAFGKGSRSCIGINLAYTEMYLGITAIVTAFDLKLHEFNQARDLDGARDCFIELPSPDSRGVHVKVFPRKWE